MTGQTAQVFAAYVGTKVWVAWHAVSKQGRPPTKIPYGDRGCGAESDNPATWIDRAAAENLRRVRVYDGVGIMLGDNLGNGWFLAGVDLDSAIDADGNLAPWAQAALAVVHSYQEFSPSRTGLKIYFLIAAALVRPFLDLIGVAKGAWGCKRSIPGFAATNGEKQPAIEVYCSHRFFAVTEQMWPGSPDTLARLDWDALTRLAEAIPPARQHPGMGGAEPPTPEFEDVDETQTEQKLQIALNRFPALRRKWEGDASGQSDQTRSAYDAALTHWLKAAGFTCSETRWAILENERRGLGPKRGSSVADNRYFTRLWQRITVQPSPEADPGYQQSLDEEAERERQQSRKPKPAQPGSGTLWDPWDDPPPAAWPNDVLPWAWEDMLARVSLRDGIDLGALGMATITAGSAAAPKNARFKPYAKGSWTVPPIFWLMLIADIGFRKSWLETLAFAPLREANAKVWSPYKEALADWKKLSAEERQKTDKPEDPHSFITDDATPESLQEILHKTSRGTAVIKDELVSLLEFGRYRKSNGEAARAFYLSSYDDRPHAVHRISRGGKYIEHSGLTIFGSIQPDRLAEFKRDMETDGLLQRFGPLLVSSSAPSQPDVVCDLREIHASIKRLCAAEGRLYATSSEGSELIHQTELDARDYAAITGFSPGWQGFCHKLHGTLARVAEILHMMDKPEVELIPTDTVARAHRCVHHYLLQQARDFYSSLPNSNRDLLRDIAGWLLTRSTETSADKEERILASGLTANIKACRPLGSKGINDVLDPFVIGGWLIPETDFPNNRAWMFNPAIRAVFAERQRSERERHAEIRARINRIDAGRQP